MTRLEELCKAQKNAYEWDYDILKEICEEIGRPDIFENEEDIDAIGCKLVNDFHMDLIKEKKLWYAVMIDREDDDWGTGSFDENEARRMMHENNQELEANGLEPESYIAVIDANYDEDGNPTTDGVCVEEIEE